MPSYWNIEWLNANSQRSYPLADAATKTDTSGDFVLPDDFVLALYLPVHAGLEVAPDRFFLRAVAAYGAGYSLEIGYDDNGTANTVGVAVIAKDSHTENQVYAVVGMGDFADTVGKIVIGRTESIDQQPAGRYVFTYAGGKLDQDCIRPIIRGISSIRVINGSETSEAITGHIVMAAGANIRLTPILIEGQDPTIRIDAISGEGLTETCVCSDEADAGPCIRVINDVPPTPAGKFTLLGNDCLEIDAIQNGLQLIDRCSAPCCGCQELAVITQDLSQFGDNARTLSTFLNRLETSVTQYNEVVLASRLSDRGCDACG